MPFGVSPFSPPQRSRSRRWSTILTAIGLLASTSPHPAVAQNTAPQAPSPSVESLTDSVLASHGRYRQASPSMKAQTLNDLVNAAAERQQQLTNLIKKNPGEVLRIAIPDAIRSSLPKEVQPYIEKTTEVEGKLEIMLEHTHPGSLLRYFVDTGTRRISLHFAADPPFDIPSGSQVRVNGVQVDTALALTSGSMNVQALALSLPNTFGAQKTLVMLVNFQDNTTQPYTAATVQSVVFSTTSNFDMENSYGQTWLTGDVVGWYTLPLSSTVCDYTSIATYAKQAATAAGINLSNYARYVYAFPDNACSWWGLGTVGGNPSQAWVNGSFQLKVVSHEMGHNFGLYHSNAWECGTTTLGSACSSIEYGDSVDTMGNPSSGHFNAFQKERLGWLNYGASPPITTVQTGGVYTIDPYETATMNPKALKILKSTDLTSGLKTWYYVEFRRPLGVDSFVSSNSNVLNGVVIHTGSEASANSSYLLDMTPATSSWSDPALDVGQTFTDSTSGVTITPMSVGSTGATVSVSFGPVTCAQGQPTLTLSPSATQWVKPGSSVTYTVTVTDTDNSGCATTNFDLQAAVPSGWTSSFASSSLSLSPGASASTTVTVTSPATAAEGFYTIGMTATNATNAAYTASSSVSMRISQALNVALISGQSMYKRGQTATLTATVAASGAPVSGASVAFSITKSNGTMVTGSAVTNANGVAAISYAIKKRDPVGTYQGGATASMNNVSGSGATSFTVQ